MLLQPYLNFDGNCAEAFRFYEQVLGGKIEMMQTYGDSPAAKDVPAASHERILHASLAVGDEVLMASDAPPGRYERPQGVYVSIGLKDPAEADRIYKALADNGNVVMPLAETFWAARFAMLIDRFGTPWMINCDRPA